MTSTRIDAALRRQGYCGAMDETCRRRCYRRRGHDGRCSFSSCFQLRHPRLDPLTSSSRRD